MVLARAESWYYMRATKHEDVADMFEWISEIALGAAGRIPAGSNLAGGIERNSSIACSYIPCTSYISKRRPCPKAKTRLDLQRAVILLPRAIVRNPRNSLARLSALLLWLGTHCKGG
jgi:hypothetical protein